MPTSGTGSDRRGHRIPSEPADEADLGTRSIDGRSVLAVGLAVITVVSVLAVPVAGATLGGATPSLGPTVDVAGSTTAGGLSPTAKKGSSGGPGKSDEAGKPDDAGKPDHAGSSNEDDRRGPPTTPPGQDADSQSGQGDQGPPTHAGEGGKPDHANDGDRGAEVDGHPGDEDGLEVSVSTGRPDHAGGPDADDRPAGPPEDVPASSVVDISVSNAREGDDVAIDVTPPSDPVEEPPVAFERLSFKVLRDGDFTMQVISTREPLAGSPAFDSPDRAKQLGRIRLVHSIANEDVDEVSFQLRVGRARLEATNTQPNDVVLYRYDEGEWTPLPTDFVAKTETAYVFEVTSPGMSEFAVGAKRPEFDTFWAETGASTVDSGESVSVVGRVTNTGGADGVYRAELRVDGDVVEVRRVTVAAGGTRQVNFRVTIDRPGSHTVTVGDVRAGTVEVRGDGSGGEPGTVGRAFSFALNRVLDMGRLLLAP